MPDLNYEEKWREEIKSHLIAGVDEAGRGALAGPVCAAAVILPLLKTKSLEHLKEVNDSKQLSAKKREAFFDLIQSHALCWGVGFASAAEIDDLGIIPATKKAMGIAISQLVPQPKALLIDGRIVLENLDSLQESIIKGDAKSLSIAAASIMAKVSRDRMIVETGRRWPDYRFETHKGYGTAFHREKIHELGGTPIHRKSFAPLRELEGKEEEEI